MKTPTLRKLLVSPILLFATCAFAQMPNGSTKVYPPDSPSLHLVKQTQPIYPAIAQAAHMAGQVWLTLDIGTDGHVAGVKVLNGPPMLTGAAVDCVKQWVYEPILRDGKPQTMSTTVRVDFLLAGSPAPGDAKTAERYFPLQSACIEAVSSHEDAAQQAAACTEAAQVAETLSTSDRLIEQRSAFVYASSTLRRNKQLKESLDYANKAIAVVQKGHDDDSGASSVYSTRAQAEAALGDLAAASTDLTKAEDFERKAIAKISKMNAGIVNQMYGPVLKGLLTLHAQILSAQGNTAEAEAKNAEAAKL